MAKTFIERMRDDIRRARAGENILSEEPSFVLLSDDNESAKGSGRNFITVSKSAFSRLTRLAKKHKIDVSEFTEQLVSKAK